MPPPLRSTLSPVVTYTVNWLRETAPGRYLHDFTVPVKVGGRAGGSVGDAARQLASGLLRLTPPEERERARPVLEELAIRVVRQTPVALEQRDSAEGTGGGAAVDGEKRLELDLPFLDRAQWKRRWEVMARAEVEATEDGRLLACTAESKRSLARKRAYPSHLAICGGMLRAAAGGPPPAFSLRFRDHRRVPRGTLHLEALLRAYGLDGAVKEWLGTPPAAAEDELDVALTLSMPGELIGAWLEAPGEGDPEFFPVYAAVSQAVQRALRRWAPYVYFSDLTRYDDVLAAWPLLVYQAMPPFRGRPRCEFTYDVLDLGATLRLQHSTLRGLTANLRRLRPYLEGLGKTNAARFYDPDDAAGILASVARQPRWLNGLLSADEFLVDSLLNLGLRGHAFRQTAVDRRERAVQRLGRFAGIFVTNFHRRLRRFYAARDFTPLGTLLLVEATRALRAAQGLPAPARAMLRLGAGDRQRTFASSAERTILEPSAPPS